MATFHFDLVSPAKLLFSGEVEQVDLPGAEGDFGVLADHAPTVSLLRPGILTVVAGGKTERLVVLGGFAEVSPKGLTVLADLAETVTEFNREVIAAKIAETKAAAEKLAGGSELDKALERLDHYHEIDRHLTGTAMH